MNAFLTLCCTIFWQLYLILKPFSECPAGPSLITFNSQFSAIRLSPHNCFIFVYKQTTVTAGQTLIGRVNGPAPYNTSTCIDAKTIPLVSKYLIKSNDKGSGFKGSGFKDQVKVVRCGLTFYIASSQKKEASRQWPANTDSNL
jgi:hypothetical protein